MIEKALNLIAIAKDLAAKNGETLEHFPDRHRYAHLACSVYRNRFGKIPTRAVIDCALYRIAW